MIAAVMPEKRQSASAWGRQSGNCRVAKAAKQKIDVKGWDWGGVKRSAGDLRGAQIARRFAGRLPWDLERL